MLYGAIVLAVIGVIAYVPILFAAIIAPQLGLTEVQSSTLQTTAYYQALILFVLQVSKVALDRLKARRSQTKDRLRSLSELSIALSAVIGPIESQIRGFTKKGAAEIDAVLQHALKCVEATVKLCTNNLDDRYCSVTLLTFEDGKMVRIRARSTTGRPTGKLVPRNETIAYAAARYAKETAIIHHFRGASRSRAASTGNLTMLKYRSLSSPGKPPYESILLLPLPPVTIPGQNRLRKGVVTIDAARPYEFLGKEIEILIRVQAYLDLINLMLTNHRVGVEQEVQK